jgi:hypothetical protein
MEQRIKADGVLYPNKYKDTPNKPDITGELTLTKEIMRQLVSQIKEGKEAGLRLAVWERESKAGNPYKYVSFEPIVPKPKQDNGYQKKAAPAPAPKAEEDFNDDIPF